MIKIITEDANNALVPDTDSPLTISSQVALNLEGEWNAIRGYDLLLQYFKDLDDKESVAHIEEIISDEKNHAELLRGIMLKYDGEIPVAED